MEEYNIEISPAAERDLKDLKRKLKNCLEKNTLFDNIHTGIYTSVCKKGEL